MELAQEPPSSSLQRSRITLDAAEALDKGKMLAQTVSSNFNVDNRLVIPLASRDLFTSLSTQLSSVEKRICCDLIVIRCEFEHRKVAKLGSIAGNQNLADAGTKSDSSLVDSLRLTMETGCIPLKFPTTEWF